MELKRRAAQRSRQLIRSAERHFGVAVPDPLIRFDLRGKAAGQVRRLDRHCCHIRYNTALLARHPEEFLADTVAHEAAHLVAFHVFGPDIRPHGTEWQMLMNLFGVEPRRCHDFRVDDLQTRRLRQYHYRCACRSHRLTSIRHNRVLKGQTYVCLSCGQPLERAPDPTENSKKPVR